MILIDDISKARRKLELAETTSDVQTQSDEDDCGKGKRRRHPAKKLYDSSSEEEQDNSSLPRPPPVKVSTSRVVAAVHSSDCK